MAPGGANDDSPARAGRHAAASPGTNPGTGVLTHACARVDPPARARLGIAPIRPTAQAADHTRTRVSGLTVVVDTDHPPPPIGSDRLLIMTRAAWAVTPARARTSPRPPNRVSPYLDLTGMVQISRWRYAAYLRPQLAITISSPLDWPNPRTVWNGLWHALWGVTSALFIFSLFAYLLYLLARTHYDRLWSDGRSTSALVCIKSPWARGRDRGQHPAPHRTPFDKRSFFLASTAIELSLLLGYGQSQYTGIWTNVINPTKGVRPQYSYRWRLPPSSCMKVRPGVTPASRVPLRAPIPSHQSFA